MSFTLLIVLSGCQTVKTNVEKTPSKALVLSSSTPLGKTIEDLKARYPGQGTFLPLGAASDALGARLELAKSAAKTLDVQYFLMKKDSASAVMIQAMLDAADRGVRVRLLLDDIFTTTSDKTLHLLDQHPNIEVRIFNPIQRKGIYWFNYLGTFKLTNRRMHNKSMTADSAFTIIGGRNIGDEYFALEKSTIYADFDLLASGPVVKKIANSFDTYWNFKLSIPIEHLVSAPKYSLEEMRVKFGRQLKDNYDHRYNDALNSNVLQQAIIGKGYNLGTAQFFSDSPEKVITPKTPAQRKLLSHIVPVIEGVDERLIIISPYFIPGGEGVKLLKKLVDSGKQVTVLTNSLATNNHLSAQASYSEYRKDIVRAGIDLYELRNTSMHELTGKTTGPDDLHMHTKLMFMDDDKTFVGSLNLDPRSFELNTEEGTLIKSKPLNRRLLKNFDEKLPVAAYRISLSDNGNTRWHGVIDGKTVTIKHAPDTNVFKRLLKAIAILAPDNQI